MARFLKNKKGLTWYLKQVAEKRHQFKYYAVSINTIRYFLNDSSDFKILNVYKLNQYTDCKPLTNR